jgi:hypothetical protein
MSSGGGGGGAAAGGTMLSMFGDLWSANDKSTAFDAQADELENNAVLTRKAGQFNVLRQQIIAGKKFGEMSAAYGASGLASDSGSVLDVLAASHFNSELDRLNIIHGADVRATMMENRAKEDRSASVTAMNMGYFNAVGDLLGGAGKSFQSGGSKPTNFSSSDWGGSSLSMAGGAGDDDDRYDNTGYGLAKQKEYV